MSAQPIYEVDDYYEIANVEWSWESYEFNQTAIYAKRSTGELFYAEDAGCSCPSLFEDTTVEDLRPIERLQDWYVHVGVRLDTSIGLAVDSAESARKVIEQHLQASKENA